jgi:ADP-heptose:LPS heptosyltransferase
MRILLIRFSSMGDVLLTTPVLTAVGTCFPDAFVGLVTSELYADFFAGDPRIDQLVLVKKDQPVREIAEALGPEPWDRIVDLQANKRSARLRALVPRRGSVSVFDKLYWKRLLLLAFGIDRYREDDHVVARYLKAAGLRENPSIPMPDLRLQTDSSGIAAARSRIGIGDEPQKLLALFPFSAWRNKEWPRERFAEAGLYFINKGWKVIIFGGPDDRDAGESLASAIGPGALCAAGKLRLAETAALLTQCELALGNDTGLSHCARACGTRTAIVFGATARQWGFFPWGQPLFRVFQQSLRCRPCHLHGGNRCRRGDRACLQAISAAEVIEGMRELDNQR